MEDFGSAPGVLPHVCRFVAFTVDWHSKVVAPLLENRSGHYLLKPSPGMLHWQCPYSPGGTPNVLPFIPFISFAACFQTSAERPYLAAQVIQNVSFVMGNCQDVSNLRLCRHGQHRIRKLLARGPLVLVNIEVQRKRVKKFITANDTILLAQQRQQAQLTVLRSCSRWAIWFFKSR